MSEKLENGEIPLNGKIVIRSPGKRTRVVHYNSEKSKTDPSWAQDLEAQSVINKYMKTGQWLGTPKGGYDPEGQLMHVDLQSAMNIVREATDTFLSLPSELRARFGNSPEAYVAFIQDEKNKDEAVKLGLLVKKSSVPSDADRIVGTVGDLAKEIKAGKKPAKED